MKTDRKNWFSELRLSGIILIAAVAALLCSTAAYAQKGMGDYTGIAREPIKPPITRLSGIVHEIRTHPCEHATGKAEVGTHLILKSSQNQEFNIHIGPATAVADIVKQLAVGKEIEVFGFHTEKMPADHYVAKQLVFGGRSFDLRDASLRPFWAESNLHTRGRGKNRLAIGPQSRGSIRYGSQRRPGWRGRSRRGNWQRRRFRCCVWGCDPVCGYPQGRRRLQRQLCR